MHNDKVNNGFKTNHLIGFLQVPEVKQVRTHTHMHTKCHTQIFFLELVKLIILGYFSYNRTTDHLSSLKQEQEQIHTKHVYVQV